ncbi:hypothetical protein HK100_007719 [Physocladia obscura]|uniref:GH26 domain-containing protein n=1 Tax=Physocladia obscura TaxID=109957 RepID=A0AAD5XBY6_9FUNG|nr:hypothetical protein HK100_007719 [Physocladia obscura]
MNDSKPPGSDFVDIVGTSVYQKGWGFNDATPATFVSDSIRIIYNEYALLYNKPFVISECSGGWESGSGVSPVTGAFIASVTSSVDQATFQADFWSEVLSSSLLASYPLLQGAYIFEVVKQEEFYSDFRVSNDSAVRAAFLNVVNQFDATGNMVWANAVSTTTTTTTTISTTIEALTTISSTADVSSQNSSSLKTSYFIILGFTISALLF